MSEVLDYVFEVLGELGDEAGDVEESVDTVGKGEVVGFCQDFDAVREVSLAAHAFLEGGACGSAAIHFAVE